MCPTTLLCLHQVRLTFDCRLRLVCSAKPLQFHSHANLFFRERAQSHLTSRLRQLTDRSTSMSLLVTIGLSCSLIQRIILLFALLSWALLQSSSLSSQSVV